jgi:hypothetical protein
VDELLALRVLLLDLAIHSKETIASNILT